MNHPSLLRLLAAACAPLLIGATMCEDAAPKVSAPEASVPEAAPVHQKVFERIPEEVEAAHGVREDKLNQAIERSVGDAKETP